MSWSSSSRGTSMTSDGVLARMRRGAPARQDRPLAREHPSLKLGRSSPAQRGGRTRSSRPATPRDLGHRFARSPRIFARLDLRAGRGVRCGRFARRHRGKASLGGGLGRGCERLGRGGHDLNTIPHGKSLNRNGPTMQASRAGSDVAAERRPRRRARCLGGRREPARDVALLGHVGSSSHEG